MDTLQMFVIGKERLIKGWCKNALSLTSAGEGCFPDSPNAVKWCALGALNGGRDDWHQATQILRDLIPNGQMISTYNNADTTTHADIIALFDRAIESCGGKKPRTDAELVKHWTAVVLQKHIDEHAQSEELVW